MTSPPPVRTARQRLAVLVRAAMLMMLILLAYWPALRAGFIWDDDSYVTHNRTLRSLEGLKQIWLSPGATAQYYPLVYSTFWVEYHLWQLHPLGYHVVNVLLQALNALLLWRVLRRLNVPGAGWVAALFAIHPVQVETVAWITERKNLLSGAFYFLAALAWLRFWPPDADRPGRWGWYAGTLALFACALLSKTVTCTLPVVLLIASWWKRGKLHWRQIVLIAPMLVMGLAAGLLTAWMEMTHVGAEGAEWSLNMVERFIVAGRVTWFYLLKDLWPHPLIFIYPRWEISSYRWWELGFFMAAALTLAALWVLRRRLGRGPAALAAAYAVTLFPAMGFFNVYPMRYSFVADHFQYLAILFVLIAIVASARLLTVRINHRAVFGAGCAVVLALTLLSDIHARAFTDSPALWRDTLAKNDRAWMAWTNLGIASQREKRYDDAITMFKRSLAIRPADDHALAELAATYALQGKHWTALNAYQRGLRVVPNSKLLWSNMAVELGRQDDFRGAEAACRRALAIDPQYLPAHINLAQALASEGRHGEAEAEYRQAIELDPHAPTPRLGLAVELANGGKLDQAIKQLRVALREEPDCAPARSLLVSMLTQAGRRDEARRIAGGK